MALAGSRTGSIPLVPFPGSVLRRWCRYVALAVSIGTSRCYRSAARRGQSGGEGSYGDVYIV
jgi:hypothetical protein